MKVTAITKTRRHGISEICVFVDDKKRRRILNKYPDDPAGRSKMDADLANIEAGNVRP